MSLQRLRYKVEHVPGATNLWADLLTRWGAVPVKCQLRALHFELEDVDGVAWSLVGTRELELPSVDAIRGAQEQFGQPEHDGFEQVYDEEVRVLRDAKGRFWVPKEAEELHLRLCVIAHAGPAGHRGAAIALERLQERVVWRGMRKTVEDFVKGCLHCRGAKGPALHPRPLGETKFGNAPNEVVHFDFLFVRRPKKAFYSYISIGRAHV